MLGTHCPCPERAKPAGTRCPRDTGVIHAIPVIHEHEFGDQRVDLVVLLFPDASAAYKVTQALLRAYLLAQVSGRLIKMEVVAGQGAVEASS